MPNATVKIAAIPIAPPAANGTLMAGASSSPSCEPHAHHDPQVQERGDHGGDHGDDRDRIAVDLDRGLDHAELRDEARGERHAGLREQEDVNAIASSGLRLASPLKRSSEASSSPTTTLTTPNEPMTSTE